MKWCCAGFEQLFGEQDKRGFALVVDRDYGGELGISFQYRAVDQDMHIPDTFDIPIGVIGRMRIAHCPSCGRNLRKWYKKNIDALPVAEPLE